MFFILINIQGGQAKRKKMGRKERITEKIESFPRTEW